MSERVLGRRGVKERGLGLALVQNVISSMYNGLDDLVAFTWHLHIDNSSF